jgi:hypothetical protein
MNSAAFWLTGFVLIFSAELQVFGDQKAIFKPSKIIDENNLEPVERIKGDELYTLVRAVAKYNLKRDRRCSATRVGPQLFITAHHCVEQDLRYCWMTLNYEYEMPYSSYVLLDCIGIEYMNEELDFALIEVNDTPALSEFPIIPIAPAGPTLNDPLIVSGFPKTTTYKQIDRSADCKVVSVQGHGELRFEHTCDTESNSSGSGVISRQLKALVGVHSAAGFSETNIAVPSNLILEDIATHSPKTMAKLKILKNGD